MKRFIARHVAGLPKSGIRDFFEIVSKMKDVISLGIGEPDEIAGAAIMLASQAGSFMTGQTIVVDGGRSLV